MNFLYGGGGVGGGGGRSGGSDSHGALHLPGSRVKLQPRRLRSPAAAAAAAAAGSGDSGEAGHHVRTHLFMDLAGGGSGSGGWTDGSRRGLLSRLAGLGRRDTSPPAADTSSGHLDTRRDNETVVDTRRVKAANSQQPPPPPTALQSLDQLTEDCFIVPCQLVDRFLPAGHQLPASTPSSESHSDYSGTPKINVAQRPDTAVQAIIHVLGRLQLVAHADSSLDPRPACSRQLLRRVCLEVACSLKQQLAGSLRDVVMLDNMERSERFPFILYYSLQRQPGVSGQDVAAAIVEHVRRAFVPLQCNYTGQHLLFLYQEVATIARPPLSDSRSPETATTGYIVSIFRVMKGDDRKCFERDWLSWSGARLLYRSIPACAGLRRIVMHKSTHLGADERYTHYVLCCECSRMLDHVLATIRQLPVLRGRLIGSTGIYRPVTLTCDAL